MKKHEQVNYEVTLIGEQDLSKLTKDELELLVAAYIADMKKYFAMDTQDGAK